ncbi:hypothetical protein [Rossellomorea aquimaris]|nr:hypothetical protein [Rossellomorea aquimaris]
MENKPFHYDGSIQHISDFENEENKKEEFTLTEEMRKSISGNPYMSNME